MEKYITWVDVETGGLDARTDPLLEVACLVTDLDLNIMDPAGYRAVIWYSPEEVEAIKAKTNPFVLDMHTTTGLWDKLPDGTEIEVVDEELLDYIKQWVPEANKTRLGGNSITLDRNFLNLHLPSVGNHLHYRSIDVSTIAGLAQYWTPNKLQYRKKTTHEAFSDIMESIEELRFLREHFIKG